MIFIAGIGSMLALIGGGLWYLIEAPLRNCDRAIEATLKAPATYHRVSSDGPAGAWTITYDAENSFGVPLRSSGQCLEMNGQVTWFENPRPEGTTS